MSLDRQIWNNHNLSHNIQHPYNAQIIDKPSYELYRQHADIVGAPYDWHRRPLVQNQLLIEKLVHQEKAQFYLFTENDAVVGYCLIEAPLENGTIEISDFGFYPEAVGKGLGPIFFPFILQQCFAFENVQSVVLSTRNTNHTKVPDFYSKFGFTLSYIEEKEEELLPVDSIYKEKNRPSS